MAPQTLLDHRFSRAWLQHHGDAEAPVAVIWTDPAEWKSPIPCCGSCPNCSAWVTTPQNSSRAIAMAALILDRSLPADDAAAKQIPVIYLPGSADRNCGWRGCPWELEPLIELMFRGTPWLQRNGRDWTLVAPRLCRCAESRPRRSGHQSSPQPRPAGHRASDQLRGKRLEAEDFDAYLQKTPRATCCSGWWILRPSNCLRDERWRHSPQSGKRAQVRSRQRW